MIKEKNIQNKKEFIRKLEVEEKKLVELTKKKKSTARNIKAAKNEIDELKQKVKEPVSLQEAFFLAEEIFPDVAAILQLILICPSSGAVVERGFSLMNLVMNELRSSMNISTLDATMHLNYQKTELSDIEISEIINVWKKRGNRRIEL